MTPYAGNGEPIDLCEGCGEKDDSWSCQCLTCTDCWGDGTVEVAGDPVNGPDPETIECERCDGLGRYPPFDPQAVVGVDS